MAPKIGKLLVEEGFITRKQLEDALKCQVIFGGRVGTNLVEMGIVKEIDLLRTLSKQLDLPFVTPEQLMSLSPEIINLIPKETAKEFKVIPLGLEKKRLTLAMYDPSDFTVLDAISFSTGYIVVPVVCSELSLLTALDRYYGLKRQTRHIQLKGGAGSRVRPPQIVVTNESTFPVSIDNQPECSPFNGIYGDIEPETGLQPINNTGYFQGSDPLATFFPGEKATLPDPVILRPAPVKKPVEGPKPGWPGKPRQIPLDRDHEYATAAKGHGQPQLSPMEIVLSALAEAGNRDAIAEALVAFLAGEFKRVALFMIKGTDAVGWMGRNLDHSTKGLENSRLSLNETSALKVVVDTRNFYFGHLPDSPGNRKLLAALGGKTQENVLMIPMAMMGRVVAIFYMDGSRAPGKNISHLLKLVEKASMAFEILILKNKILFG